jgi:hypothetical protein
MIFLNLSFLDFRFLLHLRHENLACTSFLHLSLGFVFTAVEMSCVNNTVIVHIGRVAAESIEISSFRHDNSDNF